MSNYPGRNESERRRSLVKIENHWPNLFNLGEGRTYVLILAERYKGGGGVAAATRMERGVINWGNPPCPLRKRKEQMQESHMRENRSAELTTKPHVRFDEKMLGIGYG